MKLSKRTKTHLIANAMFFPFGSLVVEAVHAAKPDIFNWDDDEDEKRTDK